MQTVKPIEKKARKRKTKRNQPPNPTQVKKKEKRKKKGIGVVKKTKHEYISKHLEKWCIVALARQKWENEQTTQNSKQMPA